MNKEEILKLSEKEQLQLVWTTYPEILDSLSYSSYSVVKKGVARHTYTPAETLRKLYFEDNMYYKFLILGNPNVPEYVLLQHKAERFFLLRPHLQLAK